MDGPISTDQQMDGLSYSFIEVLAQWLNNFHLQLVAFVADSTKPWILRVLLCWQREEM